MIKKKILQHIAVLTLVAYSFQFVLMPEAARAETPCWNDGTIAYLEGGTRVDKTPPEDKNVPKDGDPVNLSNGNYHYVHEDTSIPGRAMPFTLARTYNNQDNYDGPFGLGWNHNYNIFLIEASDGAANYVIRRNGDGKIDKFIDSGGGTYTSPEGVYDTLYKESSRYVIKDEHGTGYEFDENNRLARIKDRNDNEMSFYYNASGQLERITDTVGRQLAFHYNTQKKISHITDFIGRTTYYDYKDGNLKSVTTPPTSEYPQGLTTAYEYYDGTNNLKSITDAKGQAYILLTYDEFDRVYTQRYGEGTYYFSYDAEQKITRITDRSGHKTEWLFNDNGTPLRKRESTYGMRPDEPPHYETIYIYNDDKELAEIAYPKGNRTKYTYDSKGNLLEIRKVSNLGEPDIVTSFTYEPRYNFVKTITDPNPNVTTYTYDYELDPTDPNFAESGNLVKITYPAVDGQAIETEFTYNSYGQVETSADANNNVTKYEYYPETGYLKKIIAGFGTLNYVTQMTYDGVGNIETITDPKRNTTTFEYDALNQLTETVSPAPFNYVTKYSYDENGNLKQVDRETRDSLNPWQTTTYTYDILDKLKTITDDLGNTTYFSYDLNENRSTVTDAEVNVTKYLYDERDLLWKTIQLNSGREYVTEYSYDANGNLKEIKDARGNKTVYQYGGFDRLKLTTYQDGTQESYSYDAADNLKTKTNQKAETITYDYDELNRLKLKTYPDSSSVTYKYDKGSRLTDVIDVNGTISYAYDGLNRVTSVTYPGPKSVSYLYDTAGNRTKLTYPDSSYITYEYDQLNRLTSVIASNSEAISTYTYDSLSRRVNLTLANGTSTNYSYDVINRLIAISSQLSAVSYTYDKVGNRRTKTTSAGTETYVYDDIYQLTNVTYPDSRGTTYNYDKVGNRLSTVNGGTTAYIPNNMNQYDSVGDATYTYDDNGNLTNTPTSTYTYDYENRLVSARSLRGSGGDEAISAYTYDAFGRRIQKNIDGTIAKYIHDGDQVILETDSAGTTTAKYTYGPGIDEPICRLVIANEPEASEAIYYYHFDGLGSVTSLTDSTGTVVESYSYDVYGEPDNTSSIGNPYLFTARAYDPETGLYYYRARYYDPRVGRFLQKDKIGFYAGSNLYTYVDNNPVNWIDPLGLFTQGAPRGVFPRGQWPPPPSDTTSPNAPPKPPDPTKPDKEKPKKDIPDDPTPEDPTPNEPTGKPRDPADLNGDGKVDNWDWLLWFCVRRFWDLIPGGAGAPYPPGYGDEGPGSTPPIYREGYGGGII